MLKPVKMKNAVRWLVVDAAARVRLPARELMDLHAWSRNWRGGAPRALFSAACNWLEEEQGRSWYRDDQYRLPYPVPDQVEKRWGMVYDMIGAFLVDEAKDFWNKLGDTNEIDRSLYSAVDLFGSEDQNQEVREFERPDIPWNDEQNSAIRDVMRWYSDKGRAPIFRLFGYAGTGKTQLIKEIAWRIEKGEGVKKGSVLFAAYTGKAAAVMRSKGCVGATTLHSLIYRPKMDRVTGKIKGFSRNEESPLRYASILIVDEVSMVNEDMALDILKYGVMVLVVGDPFQLKPVKGEGYFVRGRADVMLTKIERQAEENPLIWLSMRLRAKKKLKPGTYGSTRIHAIGTQIDDEHVMTADQMLCGIHRTRHALNRKYRTLAGYFDQESEFPVKGERLLCKKNNKQTGVLNGTQWHCSRPRIKPIKRLKNPKNPAAGYEVTRLEGLYFKARSLDLFNSDGAPMIVDTVCSLHHFDHNLPEPPWQDIQGTDTWTFAYTQTGHSAQGSQWDKTLIVDESDVFPDQKWEHFYTQLTRTAVSAEIYL
ncbi:DNA helicase [Burkholderia phage BcepSauron]|uniref:DNA helicase n=1 Tax=Burkholderia phage BcepSauron TaxID=2530033 RepID=A0A482MLS2_9CAUD|nr:Dda-like helicase [Burkholderia phage BcepSauron]QBQ74598.1 DNA helicase [Burkholderia phage BcepSauron]